MKRWSPQRLAEVEDQRIDRFLEAVAALSKEHGLSISHEDEHGAFVVETFDAQNVEWLQRAHLGRSL